MSLILQELVVGLASGATYALIALGYTMVYGIIELINFAHGDIFMVGTFVCYSLVVALGINESSHLPAGTLILVLLLACVLAIIVCAVLGVVIERIAYRPLRNAPRLAPLISAIGVSLILEDIGKLWLGTNSITFPEIFPSVTYTIGPTSIRSVDLVVIGLAVILMVGLQWLVNRTRTGRAMRAVAQDREAAALMGVNVDRIISITFFIGAGLAGAAGFIFDLQHIPSRFTIGIDTGLIAFTAAVLGGIGNLPGAMIGGVLIGIIQSLVSIIPNNYVCTISPQLGEVCSFTGFGLPHGGDVWSSAIVFSILILILVFRPAGLLGQRLPEKV